MKPRLNNQAGLVVMQKNTRFCYNYRHSENFFIQEVIHRSIMQNNIFSTRDTLTFIDTCSLLEVPASELYLKSLKSSGDKVIVIRAVTNELRKKIREHDKDPELSDRAQAVFNLVFDYEAKGLVKIDFDDDRDTRNIADNVFLGIAFRYGLNNNIVIITQDKGLTDALLNARNNGAVNGLSVAVKRLESDGTLTEITAQYAKQDSHMERSKTSMNMNALEIPPSQLVQQFRNNTEASSKVYKNQCLMFSGRVVRTYEDGRDFITELLADDFNGRIICRFTGKPMEADGMERGQSVTVSGLLANVDVDFGEIEMQECSLGSAASASIPLQVTSVADDPVPITQIPEAGCKVKGLDGKEYTLSAIIARGSKSVVYDIEGNPKMAAKIYNPEFCTARRLEKLRLIISMGLQHDGICFPTDVLLNERAQFCGCLMPRAEGGSIEELFCTAPAFAERFKKWTKTDMVMMTKRILEYIKYIHDNGVIIGNVVPENIIYNSTEEIYFIDADSWQYKEFPCPDGDPYSTPPELQGKDFSTFLRTMGNENFGVATLVFRMMMQGYPPYASFERELPEEEIRAGKFPYTVGEFRAIKGYKAPSMEARKIWSHLVRQIKDSFIQAFHENGEHSQEGTRFPVEQWIKDVGYYYSCLPKMIRTDPVSEEVFPKEVRRALDKRQ